MATAGNDVFSDLKRRIESGDVKPVYLLHGEEGYYIDRLVEAFEQMLPEDDRAFNLYQLYAPETSPEAVMEVARRYPMMTDRQVVIVKEAQSVRADQLNKLHAYALHPNPMTVLVIACRGALAKGKELIDAIKKNGEIFESKKLNERSVGPVIQNLIGANGLTVDPKALVMLRDYIGTDVSRLYNEINKLALILGRGAQITPEVIERNIGISKDYNNFELIDAITVRDAGKAFRILDYFKSNPKNNPTVLTSAQLFTTFSNLLIYQYTRDKSPSGYMDALGFRNQWQLRPIETAARNYSVRQTIQIISAIRDFDRKTKGVGSKMNEYDLLRDLVFTVLTARGITD